MWPQIVLSIGVRELKARLSQYLKRARGGERILITDRGHAIAVLAPVTQAPSIEQVQKLVSCGMAHWGGGKPKGAARPARLKGGPSVAQTIVEDRR